MNIIDVLLTGVGLSMDAAAVSASDGLGEPGMKRRKMLVIALLFGLAQGIMPLIGYFAGSLVAGVVSAVAPYLALVLLGFIGGKMIVDAVRSKKGEPEPPKRLDPGTLAVQAVATSIDALAVGVSMLALERAGEMTVNIYIAVSAIAATTFAISLAAVMLGKRFGKALEGKAELVGGIILVAIGIKIFVEGVFFA